MPERNIDWPKLKSLIMGLAKQRKLGDEYMRRLKFELKEIIKQGATSYWIERFNEKAVYNTNNNGLVFPWILGLTPVDPLESEHIIEHSTDLPDVDVDCLPMARDRVKAYAAEKYGKEYVCSVGTWTTYKFKSAIQDACRGLGGDLRTAMALTKMLPDDVDGLKDGGYAKCSGCGCKHKLNTCPECNSEDTDDVTLGKLLNEYEILATYEHDNQEIVDKAARMVGKIKTMGKHAGGVIISNRKLLGNVPMGISKGVEGEKQWTSMWTEGRNTQLSKLGYVKWDFLGLKTLQYIHDACKLAEQTRNVKFNALPWQDNDPEKEIVGWYLDADGERHDVPMNDPEVFEMINDLRVETVFQFETDVQRGVLRNGVRDYYDLQVFNAMGHPGPIAMIPEYVARRDDKEKQWMKKEQHDIAVELIDTHGIIVYQEQLQKIWQKFAGFTAPEAESARKAVAKKWTEKLKPIKEQWIIGASKRIGKEWSEEMWRRMETFGRYAFNRSHSCAYILVAYWCAWLKAHFAPEWWAAVMSGCHSERIPKYMNTARLENVKFGPINADNLTYKFSVAPSLEVTPGLASIKGIGSKTALKLEGRYDCEDIDSFVKIHGKAKRVMEPLIKLGAFSKWHPNTKATWMWYQYKYCSGKEMTQLRRDIRKELTADWTDEKIAAERDRRKADYKRFHPNRKKIPSKIINWKPEAVDTCRDVMDLFSDDFTLQEQLDTEKKYLGYYWHSPLDLYETKGGKTIQRVKDGDGHRGEIECVVDKLTISKTKNDTRMGRLKVTDGLADCTIVLWSNQLRVLAPYLEEGFGMRIDVKYDSKYNSFALATRDTVPTQLRPRPGVGLNEE